MDEQDKNIEKIQALREMIYTAERTLEGAKAMLLQLEGKKKVGRKRKLSEDEEDGRIVEGTFDGQIMLGMDGKQYPVPANYASKSKLVQGDLLKLTITSDGSFIYKQIGPAERKTLIGTVNQDPDGNYFITADGKAYKVLLASITYFKVEPGDEVALVVPKDIESDWGSIENVIHHAVNLPEKTTYTKNKKAVFEEKEKEEGIKTEDFDLGLDDENEKEETESAKEKSEEKTAVDEWAPDLEALERELRIDLENNPNETKTDDAK